MTATTQPLSSRILGLTVIVTSLGNFVDIFDMFLFNMLRVKSLTDLGLSGDALTEAGLLISNCQMAGMFIGAYISGVLGDKLGRKYALFLSIGIYSLGSIASSFVQDVDTYALIRFITGMGIAGEFGAGITLISEKLNSEKRGYGTMVFIGMGFLGCVAAGIVTQLLPWRTAYLVGGGLGLGVLFLRVLLSESAMYTKIAAQKITRGGLRLILKNSRLLKAYLCSLCLMATGVFIPQIMYTLSPELAKAMGIQEAINPSIVFMVGFGGGVIGDMLAIRLSEYFKSRKKAVGVFLGLGIIILAKCLLFPAQTAMEFYIWSALLGLGYGIWVITAVWAAEQFGVNIRSTAATTIPNFARALTIPMNLTYGALKTYGALTAAGIIGTAIFALAVISWYLLSDTYGKNLDYYDEK